MIHAIGAICNRELLGPHPIPIRDYKSLLRYVDETLQFAIMRAMRLTKQLIHLSLLLAILLACTACVAGNPYVEVKGRQFQVEIADSREKQALGLMFRDSMAQDHGMLFIFANEAPRSFWMKNTRIPLDIIYFNSALELVSIAANTRPCRVAQCPGYPSKGPARYVLELNAGLASELELVAGDVMVLHLD